MPKSARASQTSSPRERIIDYLNANGGRVDSPDGLGLTAEMAAATGYNQVAALNAMLVRLEGEGIISRNVRGKRTLAITLKKRGGGARTNSTRATRTPARKPARRGARSTVSSTVADQVAALSADVDALAKKVRNLQRAVAR